MAGGGWLQFRNSFPSYFGYLFGLIFALGALVWLILQFRQWFRDDSEGLTVDTGELLTNLKEIHRQGGLSDEEYRSIQSRLSRTAEHAARSTVPQPASPEANSRNEKLRIHDDSASTSPSAEQGGSDGHNSRSV